MTEELLRQRGIHVTTIPFFTKSANLIDKQFSDSRQITIRQITLEGTLTINDVTIVKINESARTYYGTFTIYPDKECKSIIVTANWWGAERSGILTIVYEGVPFDLPDVGVEFPFIEPKTYGKEIILHPSGTRTASGNTGWFYEFRYVEIIAVILDVTAVSGTTPTLDVTIENLDPVSTKTDTCLTFAQKTGVATEWKYAPDTNKKFGNIIRVKYTIGGTTPSFTFTVTAIVRS